MSQKKEHIDYNIQYVLFFCYSFYKLHQSRLFNQYRSPKFHANCKLNKPILPFRHLLIKIL